MIGIPPGVRILIAMQPADAANAITLKDYSAFTAQPTT